MKSNTGLIAKRALAVIAVSVIVSATGLAQLAVESPKAQEHFNRARELSDKGEFASAASEYRRAIDAAGGKYPEAHNNLGMMLGIIGDVRAAMSAFKTAIEQDAGYPEAHYNLGLAYSLQGEGAAAERELTKAIELAEGDFAEAHNNLGILYAKKGDTSRAIMEFKIAVEQSDGFYSDAHYNLGVALFAVGKVEASIAEFRDAIDQTGFFPEAHYNLAIAFIRVGKNAEAAREFELYLQQAKNPSDGKEVRARISLLRKSSLK